MRGSGLTRYRPEQGGGGFLDSFVKDVVNEMRAGAKSEAWKGFKSGGPWGLPNIVAGGRGAIKRKADSALNSARAAAKRAVNDIFG